MTNFWSKIYNNDLDASHHLYTIVAVAYSIGKATCIT